MDCGGVDRGQDRLRAAALLTWVKQHEVDAGAREGVTTAEARRVTSRNAARVETVAAKRKRAKNKH